MFIFFIVSLVTMCIATSRSIKEFLTDWPFIITFTTRLLRSNFLRIINFPNIMLVNSPTTWTIVGSFFFLPRFFKQASLMDFPYIGTYLIVWNKGIWTCMFFSWSMISKDCSSICAGLLCMSFFGKEVQLLFEYELN